MTIARSLDPTAESPTEFYVASTLPVGGSVSLRNDKRPFGFNIGDARFAEEEFAAVARIIGYTPARAVHVYAFINADVDHKILGELAVFFARQVRGLIDFGGHLGDVGVPRGTLLQVPYMAGSIPAALHVSDVTFLEWWLTQRRFHMIK